MYFQIICLLLFQGVLSQDSSFVPNPLFQPDSPDKFLTPNNPRLKLSAVTPLEAKISSEPNIETAMARFRTSYPTSMDRGMLILRPGQSTVFMNI